MLSTAPQPARSRTPFTDSLAEIRAVERWDRIRRLLGCDTRGCRLQVHDDDPRFLGFLVEHNDERRVFEHFISADMRTAYVGDNPRNHPTCPDLATGPWEPLVPRSVAEWVAELHGPLDAERAQQAAVDERLRLEAIETDPWALHGAMLAGTGTF